MGKHLATLLLAISLLTGCNRSGAVVTTPLGSYSKEEIIGKAEEYCRNYGMIPAEVHADTELWERLLNEVIRKFIYADLSIIHAKEIDGLEEPVVSEEDIRSKYQTLLVSQKQYFAEKKEIVSAAIKYPRDTIVYYPEGLKYTKLFIVPFDSEIRGKAAILLSEGRSSEYKELMELADADILPQIRRLRQQLQNDGDFEKAAEEYGGVTEDLLYTEDFELFPAQQQALRSLKNPGDIAEYNIYQGHVFILYDRAPSFVEIPYEEVKQEIAKKILAEKKIIQHDRYMEKLYDEAIAGRKVKVRIKEITGIK